jgi:signal transduction histidine kinase
MPPPIITSLVLVGMNPTASGLVREAAGQSLPGADLVAVDSLAAALARPETAGLELLLLGEPTPDAAAQAVTTLDARGLPRWPVVVFGPDPGCGGAEVLPPEDWNVGGAARAFQAAAGTHALARENARLRGDLFTIGRRLSHDLRTPLMGISTGAEAIRETPAEDLAARDVFTGSIAQASGEITRLIDRLSAVLKATAVPRAKEPVSMGEVVWGALQRLERRVLEQGATVAQPASWPAVAGVPPWLEIAWWNLVANALDHAGPAARVELGWAQEPGGHRFWTDDQGPGVAPRGLGNLFLPFDLLHRPSAPRGWGLAIVQRLVELQGGRCGYEPRPGGGARFFFTLPA